MQETRQGLFFVVGLIADKSYLAWVPARRLHLLPLVTRYLPTCFPVSTYKLDTNSHTSSLFPLDLPRSPFLLLAAFWKIAHSKQNGDNDEMVSSTSPLPTPWYALTRSLPQAVSRQDTNGRGTICR